MRRLLATLGVATVLLTGCADGAELPSPDLRSRVDVDNAELRAAKEQIGVAACPPSTGAGSELPELVLPCLGGGRDVRLSELEGPAVVSLWASWCVSCPDELPLFQRLSEESGDRLSVLGIDYQDTQPGAALTLLAETQAVFPQLADPGGELAEHYRLTGLPAILLVDEDGEVTFLLKRIDTYSELRGLVRDHTGVDVTAG